MNNQDSKETVFVNTFTNGVLDPNAPMLGPIHDGGHIIANTAPGCWGPMITPSIRGGHEVTQPVFVEGAEIGDAVVLRIKSIQVTSDVTASGNERAIEGRFLGDPFIAGKCPSCGTLYPETKIEGIGPESVRCVNCGADVAPFAFTHGYTISFDKKRRIGITLNKESAEKVAHNAKKYMALPDNSKQNPIVTFAPHDMVGAVSRLRPFIGQLGTVPSRPIPDSHNAGDFGSALIDAPHEYKLTIEQLEERTDGHMDINRVREGAILICPVRTKGAGIYIGDVHALQGDGEIAGHTCDVAGTVMLQVGIIKGLNIDGPILLPVTEDLPYLAKPLTELEKNIAKQEAQKWGIEKLEENVNMPHLI
ncbi:MAG: acetamidase/formamidase family protein [Sedimentibacter sp.]